MMPSVTISVCCNHEDNSRAGWGCCTEECVDYVVVSVDRGCPVTPAPSESSRHLLGMLGTHSIPHSAFIIPARSFLHILFRTAAELIVWIMCNDIGDVRCDHMESLTQVWGDAAHNIHPL